MHRKDAMSYYLDDISAVVRRELPSVPAREAKNTEGVHRRKPAGTVSGPVPKDRANDRHQLQYAAGCVSHEQFVSHTGSFTILFIVFSS